jgi:1,4-dihydroxy-2-naphthoyl-CoA hydrolase
MVAMAERLRAGDLLAPEDLAALSAGPGFADHALGLVWDQVTPSHVRAHLQVTEQHHQPFGIVHGGVWCAVIETVASIAAALRVAAAGQVVVGVNNTTDFLRPVRLGRVEVTGTPIHVGRTQQLWLVELLRAEDGKPVARGQVRLQNLDAPPAGSA